MKQQINDLRDYAELSQASYFYFDLLKDSNGIPRKIYKLDEHNNKIPNDSYPRKFEEIEITLEHIVSQKYNKQEVLINEKDENTWQDKLSNSLYNTFNFDKLNGEFGEIQAKNFFHKYDLLEHQANTYSGFSATLFQDKESKEYIFAIRGTEGFFDVDAIADSSLASGLVPQSQYEDMITFYEVCIDKYPTIKNKDSLTITGHSLGGTLAQLLTLSLCDDINQTNIKEVYTFNSPGAKNLKPPYDMIIYNQTNNTNINTQNLLKTAKQLNYDTSYNIIEQKIQEIRSNQSNNNKYIGIKFYFTNTEVGTLTFDYKQIPNNLISYYQTLIRNYNNKNALSISNRIFHIESDDDSNPYNNEWQDNLIQNLGVDIDGDYIMLNLNLKGLASHKISSTLKILYFYDHLYKLESNANLIDENSKNIKLEYTHKSFNKEHSQIKSSNYDDIKKSIEYCNIIALSIYNILYRLASDRDMENNIRNINNNEKNIMNISNWLYAIINKTVFESQVAMQEINRNITNEIKSDTSNIIEWILYLAKHQIFIKILQESEIQNITNNDLEKTLAVYEYLFFITTNNKGEGLLNDTQKVKKLFTYNSTKAKMICEKNMSEKLLTCYINETMKYYPRYAQ